MLAFIAFFAFQTVSAEKMQWKELQAFHAVMSKSFHPTEEGNLQPLKENSENLLAKAKEWQKSAVPADFDKEKTTKVLVDLVAKCEAINTAVKAKANDEDLKKLITEAHEVFHQIVAKCRKPETDK